MCYIDACERQRRRTSRGDTGGHQHRSMSVSKSVQRALALALVTVSMNGRRLDAALAQNILELITLPLRLHKYQNEAFGVRDELSVKPMEQELFFVVVFDILDRLLHVGRSGAHFAHSQEEMVLLQNCTTRKNERSWHKDTAGLGRASGTKCIGVSEQNFVCSHAPRSLPQAAEFPWERWR